MNIYLVEYLVKDALGRYREDYMRFDGSTLDYVKNNALSFIMQVYDVPRDDVELFGIFKLIGECENEKT